MIANLKGAWPPLLERVPVFFRCRSLLTLNAVDATGGALFTIEGSLCGNGTENVGTAYFSFQAYLDPSNIESHSA